MGPIVENSEPGTSSDYLTPPEGEAEAETSGAEADTEEAEADTEEAEADTEEAEADMEEAEDPLQDELNSPVEETEGYSIDPWPEVDQALEEVFNWEYKD